MNTQANLQSSNWNFVESNGPNLIDNPVIEVVNSNENSNSSQDLQIEKPKIDATEATENSKYTHSAATNYGGFYKGAKYKPKILNTKLEEEFIKKERKLVPNNTSFSERMAFDIQKRATVMERLDNFVNANRPKKVQSPNLFNRLYEEYKKKKENVTKKEQPAKQIKKQTILNKSISYKNTSKQYNFDNFIQKVVNDCHNRRGQNQCYSQIQSPVLSKPRINVSFTSACKSALYDMRKINREKEKHSKLSRSIQEMLNEEQHSIQEITSLQDITAKYSINAVEICTLITQGTN